KESNSPAALYRSQSRHGSRSSQLATLPSPTLPLKISRTSHVSLKTNPIQSCTRNFVLPNRPFPSKANKRVSAKFSNQFLNDYTNVEATPPESLNLEVPPLSPEDGTEISKQNDIDKANAEQARPLTFRNRFLDFVRLSSVLNSAAESFFKSEIRRRLFVTAVLIVMSRVGYFIPLPGFDRRLIPQDYLSFVSGSVDELGDFTAELKMSFFQLGISPQIIASIIMQVLCHLVPSLVKLRKEGLDGHEKIKSYIWWMSLGFAIVEAIILACYSLPYSIYAASYRVKHVMVTSMLLVCGAMTMTWICDTISESGFGQGSSLIICVQILTGYTETLYKMLSQLSGGSVSWGPYLLAVLGVFTVVTMWAVVVTEGCRKIKLQYYGFKLASSARDDSPITEVEPYIPFTLTHQECSLLLGSPFWEHVKEILNPDNSIGAGPWVYYSIYAFFVFLFNIFDIANLPKEIADYLNKMGARIPNIKPGKATIEYLTKIQASTRGLLLSILATTSSILDHYLRNINAGFAIGLTSVLIIVGSIIELRRSYQAYNVMPSLSKALSRAGIPGLMKHLSRNQKGLWHHDMDITLEFDSLCSEYKDSEMALHQNEVKPTLRRKHAGQMREAKRGIRRFQKLMRQVSDLQTALKLMISEVPQFQEAILVIGASPLRPHHVYELSFSSASAVPSSSGEHEHEKELDFGKSRAAEVLCRKAIRVLISKGAGCASYPGPSKLFLLVKAPPCLNLPLHFLPKRDFRYSNKIVPLRLKIKRKTQDQNMDALPVSSETGSSDGLVESAPNDFIWFQCRHVIKGLASDTPTEAE
ncbi:SecY protein transport family protein, partial [Prunus dulcis]